MRIHLAPLEEKYESDCLAVLNEIFEEGLTFPTEDPLDLETFRQKYARNDIIWCAIDENDRALGFVYIRPNNVGRCSHVANCGYCVASFARGRGIGRMLVARSIEAAHEAGYRGIQFNAVVITNEAAVALYHSFGFETIGTIPGGFRQGSTEEPRYVDMYVMYLGL